jgi:hypothetical protein
MSTPPWPAGEAVSTQDAHKQAAIAALDATRAAIEAGRFIYADAAYPDRSGACWDWLMGCVRVAYGFLSAVRVRHMRVLITYEREE